VCGELQGVAVGGWVVLPFISLCMCV